MDFQRQLKSLGLSVTPVRLAVLEVVTSNPHADALAIFEKVQEKIQTTSIQAVYKNLNALIEHGVLQEIKPKGMSALYETREGDNHHHLVCRSCGRVEDTRCLHGSRPCLTSTDTKGYIVDESEIIFWGICPDCQKE